MPTTLEIKTPRLITALPGANAQQVIAADAKFMSPSLTREYALVAKKGHGAIVEDVDANRSEEHTSELQSRLHLVCRLLLEKTKENQKQVFLAILMPERGSFLEIVLDKRAKVFARIDRNRELTGTTLLRAMALATNHHLIGT